LYELGDRIKEISFVTEQIYFLQSMFSAIKINKSIEIFQIKSEKFRYVLVNTANHWFGLK